MFYLNINVETKTLKFSITTLYFVGEPNGKGFSLGSKAFVKLYRHLFLAPVSSRTSSDDLIVILNERENDEEVSFLNKVTHL